MSKVEAQLDDNKVSRRSFLYWGGEYKDDKGRKIKLTKHKWLDGSDGNRNVEKIFVKDDCFLFIVGGKLLKQNSFKFEQDSPKDEKEKKNIQSEVNLQLVGDRVKDCSIGDNHVLILTEKGKVFSWGDNFYGQLGLGDGSTFVGKTYQPSEVKGFNGEEIKSIYAYKNNSYALDSKYKLWVWGESSLLGIGTRSNMFKPCNILKEFLIEDFKINDDRIILTVKRAPDKNISEDLEEEKKKNEQETKNKMVTPEKPEVKPAAEKSIIENQNSNNISIEQKQVQDIPELAKDKELAEVTEFLKSLKDSFQQPYFKDLRERIEKLKNLKKHKIEDAWHELKKIIAKNFLKKNEKGSEIGNNLRQKDLIDTFEVFINSMMVADFQSSMKDIKNNFQSQSKNFNDKINNLLKKTSDPMVKEFLEIVNVLFSYFLSYKKIESLVHKTACHVSLLKTYHFKNVLEGIQAVNNDHDIELKIYLIEKTFSSLSYLINLVGQSLKNVEGVIEWASETDARHVDKDSENFILKYIIETTLNFKDVWRLVVDMVKKEKVATEKIDQIKEIMKIYRQLYSAQSFLRSLTLSSLFKINGEILDPKVSKEQLRNKISTLDGVIAKLKNDMDVFLKKEILGENKKSREDSFSRELITIYASSILENAYQKKIIFQLLVIFY
jgi:hypothetical protein